MDAEFIRELFSSFRPVTIRRMFGGAGIYVDGVMFALLSSAGTIYLKVDETNEPDFTAEGLPPFEVMMKGVKRGMMSYRRMPDRLYDDPDELAQWAGKALQAAQSKATPRKAAPLKTAPLKTAPRKTAPKSKANRKKLKSSRR